MYIRLNEGILTDLSRGYLQGVSFLHLVLGKGNVCRPNSPGECGALADMHTAHEEAAPSSRFYRSQMFAVCSSKDP